MKQNVLLATLTTALVATLAWVAPQGLHGAGEAEAPTSERTVIDIAAQQEIISANQSKIDAKLAEIEEQLRLARIFSSRGGKATGGTP